MINLDIQIKHKGHKITGMDQHHVIGGDEGIIDGHELDVLALESDSGDQPPDPSEPYQETQDRIKKVDRSIINPREFI